MGRIIKITEYQLSKIVKKVISEQTSKRDIIIFQSALKNTEFGYLLGNTGPKRDGVDGDFGEKTKTALIKFQKKNKITGEDGIFGEKTVKLLNNIVPNQSTRTSTNKNVKIDVDAYYLFYDGKILTLNYGDAMLGNWFANSGPAGAKNLAKIMNLKNQGPTPEGVYTLGSVQKRTNGSMVTLFKGKTYDDLLKELSKERSMIGVNYIWNSGTKQDIIAWGDYRIPITPKSSTNTFGRDSMYIHGGGFPGTIGCIDLLDQISDFVSMYDTILKVNRLKTLPLYVDYSGNFKQPVKNYVLQLPKKSANDPESQNSFLLNQIPRFGINR